MIKNVPSAEDQTSRPGGGTARAMAAGESTRPPARGGIKRIGVVVPAHNEQRLLPGCLAALQTAAACPGIPVDLLVVADACTDETADVARAGQARVISVSARNVGMARAAGMRELLGQMAGTDPAAIWLATTDADSLVPDDWLRRQVACASQDWDVVLGTVAVTDWEDHPAHVPAAYQALYEFGDGPHPHVHGANFGLRASAYLAAGGFRPLRTGEDHALLAAVTEAGYAVLQNGDICVQTSARRHARAPNGFSHLLQTLAYSAVHSADPNCGLSLPVRQGTGGHDS